MNIILCQRKLKEVDSLWKIYKSYSGECNNLIILVFDQNDIVNIQSIQYKQIFVIIANTPQNTIQSTTSLIVLSKLVFGCSNSDIYLETERYPFTKILEDIGKKMSLDCGFWLASSILFSLLLFLSCVILATIYVVLSGN